LLNLAEWNEIILAKRTDFDSQFDTHLVHMKGRVVPTFVTSLLRLGVRKFVTLIQNHENSSVRASLGKARRGEKQGDKKSGIDQSRHLHIFEPPAHSAHSRHIRDHSLQLDVGNLVELSPNLASRTLASTNHKCSQLYRSDRVSINLPKFGRIWAQFRQSSSSFSFPVLRETTGCIIKNLLNICSNSIIYDPR
jgi:hypothetical protein